MKKLFTIKFRVTNNNSVSISRGRGNNLKKRRGREVGHKEREEKREE
jgi:hypothetical protein